MNVTGVQTCALPIYVAGELVEEAHFLFVEHVLRPRVEEERARRLAREHERQHGVRAEPAPQRRFAARGLRGLDVVADGGLERDRELLEARVAAALAARHHALVVREADRGEAEARARPRWDRPRRAGPRAR